MLYIAICLLLGVGAAVAEDDQILLRYRVELLDKGKWKPVETKKTFKKGQEVRIRCLSNTAGSVYLLNTSKPYRSPVPVFKQGTGVGLKRFLGLGTPIGANQVGLVPNPEGGGSLRFSGVKGYERFLMVFVPDHLGAADGAREMMAIPAGAEGWDFEAKSSYAVEGPADYLLFHYFELRSK